ncbi:MAG TPA: hypothetical protein VM933_05355, partial [Acidimicrobiales bacterium]|nr:hypothetical protein [Acidimicrobiales bacterium]
QSFLAELVAGATGFGDAVGDEHEKVTGVKINGFVVTFMDGEGADEVSVAVDYFDDAVGSAGEGIGVTPAGTWISNSLGEGAIVR